MYLPKYLLNRQINCNVTKKSNTETLNQYIYIGLARYQKLMKGN